MSWRVPRRRKCIQYGGGGDHSRRLLVLNPIRLACLLRGPQAVKQNKMPFLPDQAAFARHIGHGGFAHGKFLLQVKWSETAGGGNIC